MTVACWAGDGGSVNVVLIGAVTLETARGDETNEVVADNGVDDKDEADDEEADEDADEEEDTDEDIGTEDIPDDKGEHVSREVDTDAVTVDLRCD